jgi:type IV pilus assembly protein PilP
LAFAPLLLLGGCGGQPHSDLVSYVNEIKSRQKGRIPPLPEIKPYETFAYSADELRDPFTAFVQEAVAAATDSGLRPDMNRRREALEQFPLDALVFSGHLERDTELWALISAPDSMVYRVKVGNYMGSNFGEILEISENRIKLRELISDGSGGWIEREAALSLAN